MTNPIAVDLTQAAKTYAIANTPYFLVRKLQADQSVRAITDTYSGPEILDALRLAVAKEPSSASEAVRPYALLTALWFKPDMTHLREASQISAPAWSWFSHIASVLIETFSPVQRQLIEVPAQLSSPYVSIGSTIPVKRIIIAP